MFPCLYLKSSSSGWNGSCYSLSEPFPPKKLSLLPDHIWHKIFANFSIEERLQLSRVSGRFSDMVFGNITELVVGNTHSSPWVRQNSSTTLCIQHTDYLVLARLLASLVKLIGPSLRRIHFGQLHPFFERNFFKLREYNRLMDQTSDRLILHCPNVRFICVYFGFKSRSLFRVIKHYGNQLDTLCFQKDDWIPRPDNPDKQIVELSFERVDMKKADFHKDLFSIQSRLDITA